MEVFPVDNDLYPTVSSRGAGYLNWVISGYSPTEDIYRVLGGQQ